MLLSPVRSHTRPQLPNAELVSTKLRDSGCAIVAMVVPMDYGVGAHDDVERVTAIVLLRGYAAPPDRVKGFASRPKLRTPSPRPAA
jgi:hypothetical protein